MVIKHTIKRAAYYDLYVAPVTELFRQLRVTICQHLTAEVLTKVQLNQHPGGLAATIEFTLAKAMHNRKVSNW